MNDTLTTKTKKTNNAERIISRCNSCRTLIREGEFAYIFDQGKKIEQPRWVKCEDCYNQLQTKIEEYKLSVSTWWKWGWIVNAVLSTITFIGVWAKRDIMDGLFAGVVIFVISIFLTWIIRLIWRPYGSTVRKLVYSVKEEVTEENPQV
jgi:hypothetical protein